MATIVTNNRVMERATLPPHFAAHPAAPTDHDMTDAAQQQRPTRQGHTSPGAREPWPEPLPQSLTDSTHPNTTQHTNTTQPAQPSQHTSRAAKLCPP